MLSWKEIKFQNSPQQVSFNNCWLIGSFLVILSMSQDMWPKTSPSTKMHINLGVFEILVYYLANTSLQRKVISWFSIIYWEVISCSFEATDNIVEPSCLTCKKLKFFLKLITLWWNDFTTSCFCPLFFFINFLKSGERCGVGLEMLLEHLKPLPFFLLKFRLE